MNDEVVIQVENLGKKYRLGQRSNERYVALRDVIAEKMKAPFHFLRRSKLADRSSAQSPISDLPSPASSPSTISDFPSSTTSPHRASNPEYLWALRDVNFEVRRGEVVGIIGRNGAGKSTLLKILSRITDPTEGRVRLKGRVGSLLEVGTGFHPELTGRENIFLNGAILGMTRVEIKSKFDEIVEFAEIEKFLDTPVKRYSSGMYVRLAFAVAAHLEPEILVVDEVLAVGDVQFQKKCLGKMQDIASGGRTVLFVSHQMAAITSLCSRGLLLGSGRILTEGAPETVIAHYLDDVRRTSRYSVSGELFTGPHFRCLSLERDTCGFGGTVAVNMTLQSPIDARVAVEVEIHNATGLPIIYTSTAPMYGKLIVLREGVSKHVRLAIGPLPLASGDYFLRFWLIKPWAENYHILPHPLAFTVSTSDPGGCGFEFKQAYNRGAISVPISFTEIPA